MSEVKVVRDEQGNAIVIIPDIIFWNKQDIDWDAVKEYLKKYLGEIIENKQTKEKIESILESIEKESLSQNNNLKIKELRQILFD